MSFGEQAADDNGDIEHLPYGYRVETAMITVDEITAATGLSAAEVRKIMVSDDPGVKRMVASILTTIERKRQQSPTEIPTS